jgi:hypothetical protein
MTALCALLVRDLRLAVRVGGGALTGVLFFLIVVTLMPFAIGPDLALLARMGPAILWLGALLASLLALDRLLAMDHEDGSLDLILTAPVPLELAVVVKAFAHWLTTGLPLVISSPLLGLLLNLEAKASGAVALTLLAGTPALTHRGIAARWSPACGPGPAADGSRADLRRRGLERGDHRAGPVWRAFRYPLRAHADKPRDRPPRRCGRATAGVGMSAKLHDMRAARRAARQIAAGANHD